MSEDSFSILYRIEWVVTDGLFVPLHQHGNFQYPVSDRMGCNSRRSIARPLRAHFQYPVSDRMGCNSVSRLRPGPRRSAFSILYRIEWVVTTFAEAASLLVALFQYPVSDRMGCNFLNLSQFLEALKLSVSCIGSNGL